MAEGHGAVPTDRERARSVVAAAKTGREHRRLVIRHPVHSSTRLGTLRSIQLGDVATPSLVELLTRWRADHQDAFASRFQVTPDGTRQWLRERIIGNPDRILFLVRDSTDRPVGHLGVILHSASDLSTEVDAVLRGEDAATGTMAGALRTLEQWAAAELGTTHIWLRVLASNKRANSFYDRLGYAETGRQPLVSVRKDGVIHLVPGSGPIADEFVTMERRSSVRGRAEYRQVRSPGRPGA